MALSTAIGLSEEGSMLLDTATDFFATSCDRAYVRSQLETPSGFEDSLWRQIVDLGWIGLGVPEDLGGAGLGLAEAITIAEPMGRALGALPFVSTQLFVEGLTAGGSNRLCERYLPQVVAGAPATVALMEPGGSWLLGEPRCTMTLTPNGFTLSGVKTFVGDAGVAHAALVSANMDGQMVFAVLNLDDPRGLSITRETVIDETQRSFRVEFSDVSIDADNLIEGPDAQAVMRRVQEAAWMLNAAQSVGGIAGTLALIVEYLNTRKAFGRKIGGYQSLKHPSVEILIGLERARSHLYHAATVLKLGESAEIALRMAKAQSNETFAFAGDRAIQFHGAFGFTYDCDAQLFLRRALWLQYNYGDPAHQRKRLAPLLL
jgi:acyl-CoA dehydrogenase